MKRALLILAVVGGALGGAVPTHAQVPGRGGITISPPFQQVVFSGQGTTAVRLTVTNNESMAETFNLSVVDFKALDETGGILFSGLNGDSGFGQYSLAKWATLSQPTITLTPNQSQVVMVQLANDPAVQVGGHYGAILVTKANTVGGGGQNQVSLRQVGASLIFAIKEGDLNYNLDLKNLIGLPKFALIPPADVRLRFYDGGDVHVIPRGTVTITDSLGRQVSKGIINTESGIILPASYRQYEIAMQPVAKALWPGRYVLTASYRYESTDQLQTYTTTLWVGSWLAIGLMVAVIIVVIAGLVVVWRIWNRRRYLPH